MVSLTNSELSAFTEGVSSVGTFFLNKVFNDSDVFRTDVSFRLIMILS